MAARLTGVILSSPDPASPTGRRRDLGYFGMDPGAGRLFGRPIVVAGRLPDERRAEEAVVDEELAARRHLRVGSVWRVGAYTMAQFEQAGGETSTLPAGPTVGLRIVGIVRHPVDLRPPVTAQDNLYINHGDLYLTPAYWHHYGPDLAGYGVFIGVALQHGEADLPRFTADVRRLLGQEALVGGVDPGRSLTASGGGAVPGLRRAIRLESGALLTFAALAAVAALLLVGQNLGRQIFLESVEDPTLRALGMTRGELVGVALVRAALIGVAGAAVAVAAAVSLSPLTPIGLARRAELHPGLSADLAVLAPGALAVVTLVAVCAAMPAWRASRTHAGALGVVELPSPGRPSRVAGAFARASFPPAAVTGVRLALEPGRGRTAVPVRSAIAGAAAAVCALTAAGVFGASLAWLAGTPAAYGWTWNVSVGNFASIPEARRAARMLDATQGVDGYLRAVTGELLVDGRRLEVMAIEQGKGTVPLAVLEGREPGRPSEVALGATTLRRLGKHIGDTVALAVSPGQLSQRRRVVGRMVLSAGPLDSAIAPGKGAVVDIEAFRRLAPEVAPQVFLVRLDPATDRSRTIDGLQRAFPGTLVRPWRTPTLATFSESATCPAYSPAWWRSWPLAP